jgi:ferredoxin
MSAAVKNLMGCVVGTDTRLMHGDLAANLVRLNELITPDWTLVDGLVGMEGNGPGDGIPKRLNMLLSATDSFLLDLLIARMIGLNRENIPYLTIAHRMGHISDADMILVDGVEPLVEFEPPPRRGLVTRVLDHSLLGGVRDLSRPIHSSEAMRESLYRLGIIQDVYRQTDARIEQLVFNREKCDECGRCLTICPMQLPITSSDFGFLESPACLGCVYCVLICPHEAISIRGELGYLEDHLARYGEVIRCLQAPP